MIVRSTFGMSPSSDVSWSRRTVFAVRLEDLQKSVVGGGNWDVQVLQLKHDPHVVLKVCDLASEEPRSPRRSS